ncbi:SDR family NAD(P)-dependent oxidoreductase [Streptomyces sp. NPDC050674]|uniref:SDR family NAD(P)-dependent oxidoreductase n=1 Tax=Streptomyces sp. NPDC050674 TaxID=3157216 RepID=UPI0034365A4B
MRPRRHPDRRWSSMGRLGERAVIVTGGAGGIGSTLARSLAAEGASVVIADVRDAEGTDLAAALGGRAGFRHGRPRRRVHPRGSPSPASESPGKSPAGCCSSSPTTFSTGCAFIVDGGLLPGHRPSWTPAAMTESPVTASPGCPPGHRPIRAAADRPVADRRDPAGQEPADGSGSCRWVTGPAGTAGTTPCPDRPSGTCAARCRTAGTSGPGRPGDR